MGQISRIEQVFQNLDRWRHLPAYQLERRADIFFSIYLREVLQKHFDDSISPIVIPEFPLKKATTFHSKKVDYVAFGAKSVYFVELKTDCESLNDDQDLYLKTAKNTGIAEVLQGILLVAGRSDSKSKYAHLLDLLLKAAQIQKTDVGHVVQANVPIRLVYLIPTLRPNFKIDQDDHVITFERFADLLDVDDDPVTKLFRRSLKRWCALAGSITPGECDDE